MGFLTRNIGSLAYWVVRKSVKGAAALGVVGAGWNAATGQPIATGTGVVDSAERSVATGYDLATQAAVGITQYVAPNATPPVAGAASTLRSVYSSVWNFGRDLAGRGFSLASDAAPVVATQIANIPVRANPGQSPAPGGPPTVADQSPVPGAAPQTQGGQPVTAPATGPQSQFQRDRAARAAQEQTDARAMRMTTSRAIMARIDAGSGGENDPITVIQNHRVEAVLIRRPDDSWQVQTGTGGSRRTTFISSDQMRATAAEYINNPQAFAQLPTQNPSYQRWVASRAGGIPTAPPGQPRRTPVMHGGAAVQGQLPPAQQAFGAAINWPPPTDGFEEVRATATAGAYAQGFMYQRAQETRAALPQAASGRYAGRNDPGMAPTELVDAGPADRGPAIPAAGLGRSGASRNNPDLTTTPAQSPRVGPGSPSTRLANLQPGPMSGGNG